MSGRNKNYPAVDLSKLLKLFNWWPAPASMRRHLRLAYIIYKTYSKPKLIYQNIYFLLNWQRFSQDNLCLILYCLDKLYYG